MKTVKYKSRYRLEFKQEQNTPVKLTKSRALNSETFLAELWIGRERREIVLTN